MLNDLFINTLILIAGTFVGGHILREAPENAMKKVYGKILMGIGGGLVGILMMVYTIQVVGTNTLLDLRALVMIMISSVGGLVASIITGIIIVIYRVGYFGINQSSIFAIIHIAVYIIFFHIINIKIKGYSKNWFAKLAVVLFVLTITFFYLLRDVGGHLIIIFKFVLVVMCTGTLEYYLFSYAKKSNEIYRNYKKESTRDFLTGLCNTRNFDNLLDISYSRVKENNEKLSCLMIDIDHFKKINDTYGHSAGDAVLRELAVILKKNCRNFDIIGRVGGEEFCVLLLDCDRTRSFEIGMRIKNSVKENKFHIGENEVVKITVSVGIATYPDTVGNVEEVMKMADDALYKAKRTGRDKVCDQSLCKSE